MRSVRDILAEMLDLEELVRASGPQSDDKRPLREQYWLVLALAPRWANWSEEQLQHYEGDLEASYRDLLACARCTGECTTSVAGRDSVGNVVEPRFYAPWTNYLVRCRSAWKRRQEAETEEPQWPVAFAVHACPGVSERRKAIREALGRS